MLNPYTNRFPFEAIRQTPVLPQPFCAMHRAMPTRYTEVRWFTETAWSTAPHGVCPGTDTRFRHHGRSSMPAGNRPAQFRRDHRYQSFV